MTAEIAILNRHAVALAADSAVTLRTPEGQKVYYTNKLFTLSKFHPVGIMVYGAAEFMGVPWETIVKQYRRHLGQRYFDRLDQYAQNFLTFLERSSVFFPSSRQTEYVENLVFAWLMRLKGRLVEAAKDKLTASGKIPEREVRSLFQQILRDDMGHLRRHRVLPRLSTLPPRVILDKYRRVIRAAARESLQRLLSSVPLGTIESAAALALSRDLYWHNESGIVIAGFGNSDYLPRLRCYKMDTILASRLRVLEESRKRSEIDLQGESASLIAFAQGEMVALFMEGVDPDFRGNVRAFVSEALLDGYPSLLTKQLEPHVSPQVRRAVLRRVRRRLVDALESEMQHYSKEFHTDPVVDIVNHLPKEELAAMAEALVNLTSFKRHVTREAETVGGPIDVAVISRGDGFIWIKRKHYFNKDLNPQFVVNYFRDDRKPN